MESRGVADGLLWLLGFGALANGLAMLAAPEPWFARVAASTGAYNQHLVRDVGGAYVATGVAALWAARAPHWRAPLAAVAALFHGLHGVVHVLDVAAGRLPPAHLLEDLPTVYAPTLALIAIAIVSLRAARRSGAAHPRRERARAHPKE
jgi:hypothetical protein